MQAPTQPAAVLQVSLVTRYRQFKLIMVVDYANGRVCDLHTLACPEVTPKAHTCTDKENAADEFRQRGTVAASHRPHPAGAVMHMAAA